MRVLLIAILFSLTIAVSAQDRPFAEGVLENRNPYVGQPIVYTLRIYTLGETNNSRVIEPPFNGLGRAAFSLAATSSSEVIGTTLYQVIEQPYVLYPLRAGSLTIEPFQIELPETPFQDGTTILTEPITIEVQAIPDGTPASYTNAVGQFEVEARTNLSQVISGDAITLSLTVSGSGNLEQLIAPDIVLPESWQVFDSETSLEQDSLRFGRKTFEWTVFPYGEGQAEIPSIEFSYFNPRSGQFEMRRTATIALTILPGLESVAPTIPTREASIAISSAPESKAIASALAAYPPLWFWFLWLIPPLFMFMLWLSTRPTPERRSRQQRIPRGSRTMREFRQALKQAQQDQPRLAYQRIEVAIYAYLSTRFGENISFDNAAKMIGSLSIPLQEQVISCIEQAHDGQYAPLNQADVISLLKQTLQVFTALERELR